jgi:hypothetical protein
MIASFILGTGKKPHNTFDRRKITITKMRNGRDGLSTAFCLVH